MSTAEPRSPLTIIAMFAGIIEASAIASLPFLGEDSQSIYTWFLVGFPPFLTLLFFLTLNFNTKSLYGPEEHGEDSVDAEPARNFSSQQQIPQLILPPSISPSMSESNESTVMISGENIQGLRELLAAHAVRESSPGRLILLDLERGTRTTITTDTAPPSSSG